VTSYEEDSLLDSGRQHELRREMQSKMLMTEEVVRILNTIQDRMEKHLCWDQTSNMQQGKDY